MTTAYTSLLGLALPVTGELSGTWGDTVNNSITSLLDSAIAGTQTLTADTTLTTTTGAANQSRQAILLCSPASANITITAPAQSKIYTVINTSATYTVKICGVGPTTGVTLGVSEKAVVAWNGSDFVRISNTGGAGVFTSVTDSGLTSGRVTYATTAGLLTDSANLTFNGTTLTANTIGAFTLSGTVAGGGNQLNNVIIGTSTPLAGTFTALTATGATTFNTTTNNQSYTTTGAGTITISSGTAGTINNMSIGATTALAGTFTTLTSTGNTTIGDAVADTITVNGQFVTGTILRSAQTATNTLSLAAYDTDGLAYTNLITLTASTTPTLALTSTGVGTINNMSIGATTASTGAFTTLTSNGATTFTAGTASTTTGTGTLVITGGLGVSGRINAANFDGIVGANTAAAGAFTTLSATGAVTANTTTNAQSYTTTGAGTITISSGTTGTINNMSIGATTTSTGAFTTLAASSTVSGTGFSTYLASPPAIGGTAAAAGAFTTLSASSTVSGTGFSTYLASPPAIGGTTAAAGAFTTLTASTSIAVSGVAVPTISSTSTLTNKWVQPRVLASTANSATPTLNTDSYDILVITAQTVAITSFTTNLTGTPVNGQKLWISITGTTAIAITWGASFESSTATLPSTTVTTNRLDIGFVWNVATSKWRCLASA